MDVPAFLPAVAPPSCFHTLRRPVPLPDMHTIITHKVGRYGHLQHTFAGKIANVTINMIGVINQSFNR